MKRLSIIKMKRNKNGMSSLEIIISFVIFTGFVGFMFLAFPLNKVEKNRVGLDIAEREILNFANVQMHEFSVVVDDAKIDDSGMNCSVFNSNWGVESIIIRNESNDIVNGTHEGSIISINSKTRFYEIFSLQEFVENNFSDEECLTLSSEDYQVGILRTYKVLSYDKITALKEMYFSSYSDLLTNFSIPRREDFGFALRELSGESILEVFNKKPARAQIIARNTPVQIAYPNGSLKYAVLNVQVW